jgi:hypothetical protein
MASGTGARAGSPMNRLATAGWRRLIAGLALAILTAAPVLLRRGRGMTVTAAGRGGSP